MLPGAGCEATLPARAFGDMSASDGMITIDEGLGAQARNPPPAPQHFDLGSRGQLNQCAPAGMQTHEFRFRAAGRQFYAFVVIGPRGPQREAEGILDSLKVTPLVRDGG
jgi:hypothetical protein